MAWNNTAAIDARNATLPRGQLARAAGYNRHIQVLRSAAGFYIGTTTECWSPLSRESVEYWPTADQAEAALASGNWTQRDEP